MIIMSWNLNVILGKEKQEIPMSVAPRGGSQRLTI